MSFILLLPQSWLFLSPLLIFSFDPTFIILAENWKNDLSGSDDTSVLLLLKQDSPILLFLVLPTQMLFVLIARARITQLDFWQI